MNIEQLDPNDTYTSDAIKQIIDEIADKHGAVYVHSEPDRWELEFEAYGFTFRLPFKKAQEK